MKAALALALLAPIVAAASPSAPTPAPSGWPGSLRLGLPTSLPGYESAPKDPYPETAENGMGVYTQVSRRYQRIESTSVARSLVLVVQDYGSGKNLTGQIRDATKEAGKSSGFSAREESLGGRAAFVVFHREGDKPVTIVTVIATPSRLVLGVGDNIDEEETLKLVARVDFRKIAEAR